MISELLLLSGNDIPFTEAQINIHQPTIKEIAYIGEESFFIGCELLNFSKDILAEKDRNNLEDKTNFEVLMSIMENRDIAMQKSKTCANMVLMLIFPSYEICIKSNSICLKKDKEVHYINNKNFESFKQILTSMFCLKFEGNQAQQKYNPANKAAEKIAEKLKKGQEKIDDLKGKKEQKIAVLSRYVSILAVGLQKDCNSLLQYTVFQLYDEFRRFELKQDFDINLKARLAGAKDLDEIEDWMKDIHS